ncbi:response regulator transcription factor [soil metagenome]
MIRVLLVDDHRLVRAGLAALLSTADDIAVVGEAGEGAEAVELAGRTSPEVVLVDLSMPCIAGVGATRMLSAAQPEVRVVVLSSFSEDSRVRQAIGAGAIGYLFTANAPETVLAAVRSAAEGHAPLDPRIAGALLPGSAAAAPTNQLSDRESQVLRLAAQGLANKQIGRTLGITERTVKVHLGNVFRRIGVADRTSAAMWARDNLPAEPG